MFPTLNKEVNKKASWEFLPIKDIRDNTVIKKNGGLVALVMVSSINFALKNFDEQQGIIMQFQGYLNSLDFSTQIYIQSRRLDIKPYIHILEDRLKNQTNNLLQIQTIEYISFIEEFTESQNIMSKSFFVAIPYTGAVLNLKKTKKNTEAVKKDYHVQLDQRVAIVEQGLSRCGLRTARLNTEELVELFHDIFNPDETKT